MEDNNSFDRISLIGMPGCGKTTIGKVVAKELGYNFYDMDSFIEEISGKTVKELFEIGEDEFRNWETEACKILLEKKRALISTGGGVVKREENRKLLNEKSLVVFINRHIEEIISDVDVESRPLLANGIAKVYKLYEERFPLYNEIYHIEIENKGFIRNVIDEVKNKVRGYIKE